MSITSRAYRRGRPALEPITDVPDSAADVVQVVGHVMQEVLAEGLDREDGTVAPTPGALPVVIADLVECCCSRLCRGQELDADYGRVLDPIAFRDRRGVLVPVLESRIGLQTHEVHARLEHTAYVADMAAVLQW